MRSVEGQSIASAIQRQSAVAMAKKSIHGYGLGECRAPGVLLTRASRVAAPRAVEVWTEALIVNGSSAPSFEDS